MISLFVVMVCVVAFFAQPDWALDCAEPALIRFLSCQFYHRDASHLASNMLVIFGLGLRFEERHGRALLLPFCVGTGTVALGLELLCNIEYSGIIFGASGMGSALIGAYVRNLLTFFLVSPLLVPMFLGAVWGPPDHAHVAHISGAIIGFTFTQLTKCKSTNSQNTSKTLPEPTPYE